MPPNIAISTVSMGWHETHTLEWKIQAAKQAGFEGIELFIDDVDAFCRRHGISRVQAGSRISQLCANADLTILCVGSLDNFEGEPTPLQDRLRIAIEWLDMAHELRTDVIQIPSNDNKNAIGDESVIVSDFQALSDLGLKRQPPISFAYEALGWGTHVADWEASLRIVQLVGRSNFGLCLDTYHILSRLWADPRAHSGMRPGGRAALRDSLQRFLELCPKDKIIYMQLSDAERMSPPILPGHPAYHEDKDGTHSWCTYGRLFPFEGEHGAYLPMKEIMSAWLEGSGYRGWVSMEVFHRSMKEKDLGPDYWAHRGRVSWDKATQRVRSRG
ncbi:xylose isomerase-like protein [Exophiala viscosa]|uniref:Xylose isomerase-like protein n=1 Tax=Exophiala viscosa TaxID=2486360 RepID=A0AAN6I9R8_9EURO|nr:xylose isomerase-like protein [Exophiala viscosa]KAI1620570.1 xylose isomerase-like protein [Exophiala viscosa]